MEVVIDGVSKQKPNGTWAWRWERVNQANNKVSIKVIDDEENLNFRPYTYTPWSISKVELYKLHNQKVILVLKVWPSWGSLRPLRSPQKQSHEKV